jgi:phosphate transport system substrate-binding protein
MNRRTVSLLSLGLSIGLVATACSSSSKTPSSSSATVVNELGAAYDTSTATAVSLSGAGANSIEPFFDAVFYAYHKANPKTTITYSPAGSSVGITDIEQSTVDFGDTEVPMSSSDLAKVPQTILQVPVDLGGVAISYNLPGVTKNLELDGPTLAAIFDGSITNWDSPQIAAVSGVSGLPNLAIVPVHRADSSGPGWDLDDYLIKTSPAWVAKIGTAKPSKSWPLAKVGIGEQLNTGVASYIHQTPGAIGFVSYGYALEAGFTNASIKNHAGDFVAPSAQGIAAAGSQATDLSAKNFAIIDEPGAATYPLANFSWTLLDQKQSDAAKGLALGKLFDYVVTTAQAQATGLGYSPLPPDAVQLAESTLQQLESSAGAPLFTT